MGESGNSLEVSAIMREIRERVQAKRRRNGAGVEGLSGGSEAPEIYLERLTKASLELREAIGRLGEMPQGPRTWRARVGAAAVRAVRRGIFWHTAQVKEAEEKAAAALEEQARAIEGLAAAMGQLWRRQEEQAAKQAAAVDATEARISELEMALRERDGRGAGKAAAAHPGAGR